MEIELFLPNAFPVVSSRFDSRVDVVPSPGNDFFILPSLTSLNQLPHKQKVEISKQLIDIETIINALLGLPLRCSTSICVYRYLFLINWQLSDRAVRL
jgi:hypothetical protein